MTIDARLKSLERQRVAGCHTPTFVVVFIHAGTPSDAPPPERCPVCGQVREILRFRVVVEE